ncbi:hypothetical protein [Stenotrophomonas phage BUCT603]|nr:hypothetical protein [Stenotrophomonas phage BUCT603]
MREAIRGQALWRYRKSGHAARHGYTTIMGSEELRHYDYETA